MPVFQYRAVQTDGKIAEGQLEADGRQEAFRQMEAKGLRPIRLDERGGTTVKQSPKKRLLPVRLLLVLLLASSLFLGLIFAVAGAGLYGSPLSGFPASTVALRLVVILVAPVVLLTGLLVLSKTRKTLGTLLIVSALLAAGLGLCDDFRYIWEWFFLAHVWGPMVAMGFWLCLSDNKQ
jgi:hypothetical protein